MADAFTYDTTTNRGKVRWKIGDTREATAWFTDAEIDLALTEGGTVNTACAILIQCLLVDRARRARSYSDSNLGISYDDTAQVAALQAALESFGGPPSKEYPLADVTMPALLPMDRGYDETSTS